MSGMKLSSTQQEVMKWLQHGWSARQASGDVIEVNGRKLCTVSTMRVLERHGLVIYEASGRYWIATEKGRFQHEKD